MLSHQLTLLLSFFILFVFSTLFNSCSENYSGNSQIPIEQETNKHAVYIQKQLGRFKNNNLEQITAQYGTPYWNYAKKYGMPAYQKWEIPLEQNGVVNNMLLYTLIDEEKLTFEIINYDLLRQMKGSKRASYSLFFLKLHEGGFQVDERTLQYAEKMLERIERYKEEDKQAQKVLNTQKQASSSYY